MAEAQHSDQPAATGPRFPWRALAWSLLLLGAVIAAVAASGALRALLAAALARVRPGAVLVTLPGQALAILLCVLAQQALRPGVSFGASLVSRLVRDAANNLPLMPPGPGDAAGARVLVLAGGSLRAAVSVRALDIMAELLGQLPYMAVALVVLSRLWRGNGPQWSAGSRPAGAAGLAAGAALLAMAGAAWWWRRVGRWGAPAQRLRSQARLLAREMHARRQGMPLAVLLHTAAWGVSGVQIWLAARVLGLALGLGGGIALESAASSARVLLFFIPGGLVMQEAGIIGAGLVCGLFPAQALALALVLRLRDIVFGFGVLLWPIMEWRARLRRRSPGG